MLVRNYSCFSCNTNYCQIGERNTWWRQYRKCPWISDWIY